MEIAGEDECVGFLRDCLKVFSISQKVYIHISYYNLPKSILGRVNADIEIIKKKRFYGIFKQYTVTNISRKIKGKEFYIKINSIFLQIENRDIREEVVKSIIIHELLHIERNDLIETSKNYKMRKHKRIHRSLEKEAFLRMNLLRKVEGLKELDNKNYIEREISNLIKN